MPSQPPMAFMGAVILTPICLIIGIVSMVIGNLVPGSALAGVVNPLADIAFSILTLAISTLFICTMGAQMGLIDVEPDDVEDPPNHVDPPPVYEADRPPAYEEAIPQVQPVHPLALLPVHPLALLPVPPPTAGPPAGPTSGPPAGPPASPVVSPVASPNVKQVEHPVLDEVLNAVLAQNIRLQSIDLITRRSRQRQREALVQARRQNDRLTSDLISERAGRALDADATPAIIDQLRGDLQLGWEKNARMRVALSKARVKGFELEHVVDDLRDRVLELESGEERKRLFEEMEALQEVVTSLEEAWAVDRECLLDQGEERAMRVWDLEGRVDGLERELRSRPVGGLLGSVYLQDSGESGASLSIGVKRRRV